jgi:hypothetical protein
MPCSDWPGLFGGRGQLATETESGRLDARPAKPTVNCQQETQVRLLDCVTCIVPAMGSPAPCSMTLSAQCLLPWVKEEVTSLNAHCLLPFLNNSWQGVAPQDLCTCCALSRTLAVQLCLCNSLLTSSRSPSQKYLLWIPCSSLSLPVTCSIWGQST